MKKRPDPSLDDAIMDYIATIYRIVGDAERGGMTALDLIRTLDAARAKFMAERRTILFKR